MSEQLNTGVSIVVCCFNSSKVISPTLRALLNQKLPTSLNIEIILIDNNCTDNTVQVAKKELVNTKIECRFFKEDKPGLINARKKGVEQAKFEILVFVDDDNILDPNYVNIVHRIFLEKPEVGAVGGMIEPFPESAPPPWFTDYLGVYACGSQANYSGKVSKTRMMLVGAGIAFRTHILKSIFKLDKPLYLVGRTGNIMLRGEDAELCMRCVLLGWELWYEESLKLQHYILTNRLNWNFLINVRRGGGAAELVLDIYKKIISKKQPLSYELLSKFIYKEWSIFWKTKINVDSLFEEGNDDAFQFAYLSGMTDAFGKIGKQKYDEMVSNISEVANYLHSYRPMHNKINKTNNLIVTISDQNYVQQAKQLFSSIYHNSGWRGDYMLLSSGIDEADLAWFRQKGIIVKECEPLESGHTQADDKCHWPAAVLSTLYLFQTEFKKWNRIIYLDADIIVRASLDKLLNVKEFAAVQGLFAPKLRDRIIAHRDDISSELYEQLLNRYSYFTPNFNGGVIVINTKIIENKTFPSLLSLAEQYKGPFTRNEEAILNFYFNDNWEKLPLVYNVYINSINKQEKAKGIIFHFVGVDRTEVERPWHPDNIFYREWIENLQKADSIDLSHIPEAREEWSNFTVWRRSLGYKVKNVLFYLRFCKEYSSHVQFCIDILKPITNKIFRKSKEAL
jgi:glycosyltransferase involved in cell wall biosynthesis